MPVRSSGDERERDSSHKVVVRYADGRMVRAYLPVGGDLLSVSHGTETLALEDASGAPIQCHPKEIKAIFVVKSFEGNPNYVEFKNFPERPGEPGLWVRVRFGDGESLEGVAPNSLATFADPIFTMTPPDPQSNNQAVLVSKRSLTEMQILGFEEAR